MTNPFMADEPPRESAPKPPSPKPAKPKPAPAAAPRAQETPRLHQSTAKTLIRCPKRAWLEHPMLGGQRHESTAAMLDGCLFERLITGYGIDEIEVIDADSFRTKAAQEQRDAALAARRMPVLASKFEGLSRSAGIIAEKLVERIPEWADAQDQVYLEWESNGVLCAGTLDRLLLADDTYTIIDLKSTADAYPDACARTVTKYGYDIQEAAYREAIETLHPRLAGRGQFVFAFYETQEPYCVTPCVTTGQMQRLGRARWDRAKALWRECMASGVWPEYVSQGEYALLDCRPWDLTEAEIDGEDDEEAAA